MIFLNLRRKINTINRLHLDILKMNNQKDINSIKKEFKLLKKTIYHLEKKKIRLRDFNLMNLKKINLLR